MKIHNPNLTQNAKELRKTMTSQERKLWFNFLRRYPVRILRQKVIGDYVVDFYCANAKLVIEVDGGYHNEQVQRKSDELRTETLKGYGLDVMRVLNGAVDDDFDAVCQEINVLILERIKKE